MNRRAKRAYEVERQQVASRSVEDDATPGAVADGDRFNERAHCGKLVFAVSELRRGRKTAGSVDGASHAKLRHTYAVALSSIIFMSATHGICSASACCSRGSTRVITENGRYALLAASHIARVSAPLAWPTITICSPAASFDDNAAAMNGTARPISSRRPPNALIAAAARSSEARSPVRCASVSALKAATDVGAGSAPS